MLDQLRGAVRPLLTLFGFIVVSYLVIMNKVTTNEYTLMVVGMVSYWFAERNSTKKVK